MKLHGMTPCCGRPVYLGRPSRDDGTWVRQCKGCLAVYYIAREVIEPDIDRLWWHRRWSNDNPTYQLRVNPDQPIFSAHYHWTEKEWVKA